MSEQTILQNAPSNLDEDELVDALKVAPPSTRSVRFTRVLSALLLVALGATGATWWAQRDGGTSPTSGRPSFADGALPSGFPGGLPGAAAPGGGTSPTTAAGTTGTASSTAATTGEVVLVDGAKVYVRTASGAVVTVTTSAGTTVTRAAPSTVAKLAAGDTVEVTGTTTSSGVTATAITAS